MKPARPPKTRRATTHTPPPVVAAECCGNCARWDKLTAASQVAGEPERGICCGEPPTVFHTPTPENPIATLSTNAVTTTGRPGCHLWKAAAS